MLKKILFASVCFAGLGLAGFAQAEEQVKTEAIKTREIKIKSETDKNDIYQIGKGVDFGVTTLNKKEVSAFTSATGDVNEALRLLPHIEFDKKNNTTKEVDLLDLRPLDISISGGRANDNNIAIDGVNITSHLSNSEESAANYDQVASGKAQFQWVDESLIDNIELGDSNVSAKSGNFTGGVLNITTRSPKGRLGLNASSSCTNSERTDYVLNEKTKVALGSISPSSPPEYSRCNMGINVDFPEIAGFRFLLSHNYSYSEFVDFADVAYGGGQRNKRTENRSSMIKAQREIGNFAILDFQYTNSPYQTMYQGGNAFDNVVTTKGGGNRALVKLRSLDSGLLGAKSWDAALSYSKDDGGRNAPEVNFVWPSTSQIYTCATTGSTCTSGGFGTLNQQETEVDFNANAIWSLPVGELGAGVSFGRIVAFKERPQDNYAYRARSGAATIISSQTICMNPSDIACKAGVAALEYRITYTAYRADASLENVNAYFEWDAKFGRFATRLGSRFDYESFLGNGNFAPRISASYDFGKYLFTFGLNRYYSASFLGYAIAEGVPDTLSHQRLPTIVSGQRQYSDNWTQVLGTKIARFSDSELKTPYSDELSAAINFKLPFGIDTRLKYILRKGNDEFAYKDGGKVTYTNYLGKAATYTIYIPNNDGNSRYESLSVELAKKINKSISINSNFGWSETRHDNIDYMTLFTDESAESTLVYYNGEIISLAKLNLITQATNFATPFKVNIGIKSSFLDNRLNTSIAARWSDKYDSIGSLGTSTKINGVSYANYGQIKYDAKTEVDLKADYLLVNKGGVGVTVEMSAINLLNATQNIVALSSTAPYEKGRTIWLGLKVKY